MARDVQQALDETAQLAQRIYPPLLEAGGLAAALRAAAVSAASGVGSRSQRTRATRPRSRARSTLLSRGVERAATGARATITVREDDGALAFEVVDDGDAERVSNGCATASRRSAAG